jgi:hypothetical protein
VHHERGFLVHDVVGIKEGLQQLSRDGQQSPLNTPD